MRCVPFAIGTHQVEINPRDMSSFLVASAKTLETDFMYAIVKTGGKQYKAAKDEVLIIEKLDGEPGTKVNLDEVVLVADGSKIKVGSPFVKGARVQGEIVRQGKGPKINAFNYKPKKNERKRWGHRQPQTHVRITGIEAGS